MATVDLSQLPQPQIIEVLDFEVILSEVKAVMLAAFPQEQQASVAAALELESEPLNVIAQVVAWSGIARKEGLLALESRIDELPDPFMRKGLQLLVDGVDPEHIRQVLEVEIATWEADMKQATKVWEAAGGYAPTIGIIGAVMGLIHVMENLSDPSKLGSGIAVAFVATIYGVGSANLIFLPMAKKLQAHVALLVGVREMVVDGLICIAHGDNPRLIESRLQGYVV